MGLKNILISLGIIKHQPSAEKMPLSEIIELASDEYFDVVGEFYHKANINRFATGLFLIEYEPTTYDNQFAVKVECNGLIVGYVSKDDLDRYRSIHDNSAFKTIARINCDIGYQDAVKPVKKLDFEESDCTDGKTRTSLVIKNTYISGSFRPNLKTLHWLDGVRVKKFDKFITNRHQKNMDEYEAHLDRMANCDLDVLWMYNGNHIECLHEKISTDAVIIESDEDIFSLEITKNKHAFNKLENGFYVADFIPKYTLGIYKEAGEIDEAEASIEGMKIRIDGKIFYEMGSQQAHEFNDDYSDESMTEFIEDLAYEGVSKKDIRAKAIFKVLLFKRDQILGYVIEHESAFEINSELVEAEFKKVRNKHSLIESN